jgi:transcriptional regulator with GAF, ATPase, and Fis domain
MPTIAIPGADDLLGLFAQFGFVSRSERLVPLLEQAYKAACVSDITVLIEGETGTGKQVLAHAIHMLDSKRAGYRFVTVHCSALTETLAESELFGHQRGAFSGATADRPGLFNAAHRGTLFLDDVNDLPLRLQPKLLDVLQRRTVRAVGSDRETATDARVIAAANRPLAETVKAGAFRTDLYHRLNVIRLELPPLRERKEDLPALLLAFARRYATLYERIDSVDPELIRHFETCVFGGNVRELENAAQRMLFAKRSGHSLTLGDWMGQLESSGRPEGEPVDAVREAGDVLWPVLASQETSFATLMRRVESDLLDRALHMKGRTRREIARHLRTSERTLYHKMKLHGLGQT